MLFQSRLPCLDDNPRSNILCIVLELEIPCRISTMWAAQSRLICCVCSDTTPVCVGEFQYGVRAVEAWVASARLWCIMLVVGESHTSLRPLGAGVSWFTDLSRKSGVDVGVDDSGLVRRANEFPDMERSMVSV